MTRREHAQELRTYLQLAPFGLSDFRALDLARERQAHEAGARTRATAHERTPQQERQKAAREAERGREAWTLGQGMKKPVAGCYGRLTRWKGGGDVVYMALL
ncbi:relaxase [Escherichia coli]|uniref:relaxase n=1 Tax=Escherichia coli TaxID=562 RepID=UPI000BB785E7|nr:relaxase [Escherichia coli]SQL56548.1 relaxase [Escherichia coli]SQP95933.1 relaxase [Escherichia coli]